MKFASTRHSYIRLTPSTTRDDEYTRGHSFFACRWFRGRVFGRWPGLFVYRSGTVREATLKLRGGLPIDTL
jgi:hypothetical protein